jgi:hypothetical protein
LWCLRHWWEGAALIGGVLQGGHGRDEQHHIREQRQMDDTRSRCARPLGRRTEGRSRGYHSLFTRGRGEKYGSPLVEGIRVSSVNFWKARGLDVNCREAVVLGVNFKNLLTRTNHQNLRLGIRRKHKIENGKGPQPRTARRRKMN